MSEYTEQEQIAAAKQWFKENGMPIIIGIVVAVSSYSGWNFYQNYQTKQVATAAQIYQKFDEAMQLIVANSQESTEQIDVAAHLTEQLQNDFDSNMHAILATLQMARVEVERNNLEQAKQYLLWSSDRVPDEGLQQVVDYRLAQVEHSLGNAEAALQLLNKDNNNFSSMYQELRGDILIQQSRIEEAVAAYQKALEQAESSQKGLLELKIADSQSLINKATD